MADDTLPKLLVRNFRRWGDSRVALRKKDFGIWQDYTWKDYYEQVKYVCLGLVSLGLERGDKVSIIGDNDPQWWVIELAAQAGGAAAVGIYIDCVPGEVKHIVGHSDSTFVGARDQEQCDKLLEIKDELPKLKKVIYWDTKGMWKYDDSILISYNEVIELGKKYELSHSDSSFEAMVEQGSADEAAIFCYTSGTTGLPKGAMLSYNNILISSMSANAANPWYEDDDYLSFLSPAWITEQLLGVATPLITGTKVYFPEEPETAQQDIREVGPHIVFYGSRQWEALLSEIQVKIIETSAIKRLAYNLFLPVGFKVASLYYERQQPNLLLRLLYQVGDWVVFRPLRDKFGLLKCRVAMTGGSMLGPDAFKYFHALGIKLRNGYGLSEMPGTNWQTVDDVKAESVGRPVVGVEERISDEGEILGRGGALFTGYYKDAKSTEARLGGGWIHTGDAGYFDDDGHLYFLERVADLMQLSSGDKFSPTYLESRLKFSPYVKDAMILGVERDYVAAIIIIDYENVGKWAERRRIPYTTYVDLSQKPEVYELLCMDIGKINNTLPDHFKVKKFVNLHKEFDPDEAELTRTRKLRRSFMEDRYKDVIEAIYGGKASVDIRAEVKYRDGRKGLIETSLRIEEISFGGMS